MNRKLILAVLLMAGVLFGPASAKTDGVGLGVIIGEPTGPCFKIWTGSKTAIDGGLAWTLDHHSSMHIHVDYLMHDFSLIKVEKGRLPLYFGIGGRILFEEDSDDRVGARVPVGLEYLFDGAPMDIFLEVAPVVDLTPDTELDFNAAIGVRYFFR